ncbi:MAG: hypothetical protein IT458_13620 [Planctomycetes bacterium]|nr:hypothetical protein [Planctomycetota bacterium]
MAHPLDPELGNLLAGFSFERASPAERACLVAAIAATNDPLALARAANSHDMVVRAAALRRRAELEPDQVDHLLNLHRLLVSQGERDEAWTVLERAATLAPRDGRIMRAQLAARCDLPPAELLAYAHTFTARFPGDPFLTFVIDQLGRVLEREPVVVLEPARRRPGTHEAVPGAPGRVTAPAGSGDSRAGAR